MKIFHACLFLLLHHSFCEAQPVTPSKRPNVLFIFVDDLRPDLGCYGQAGVRSPHIDSLAAGATVFTHQYVAVPTCGPSRACLLGGRWPRNRKELQNEIFETRQAQPTPKTGPESFVERLKQNGYYTVGIGKVSHAPDGHIYKYLAPQGPALELPNSWNEMLFDAGKWGTGWNAFFGYANGSNRNQLKNQVKPYEAGEVEDEGYPDGLTAALAVKKLRELAARHEPFFLGVGLFKPHLPFNAPRKYWDLYDESKITLSPSPDMPLHVNKASLHESAEFNGYRLGDEKASLERPLTEAYARKLKHAYYAGVSYADAQIGKVLACLRELGLDRNTIIVLWGDHGWHLGDDRVWGKHTLFEWALRSPLIIKMPGSGKGRRCDQVVSSIDIYPTLTELCGIPGAPQTDGASFAALLQDPRAKGRPQLAYSYFRNGITLRTERYRLTKYFRKEEPTVELYDHEKDPNEQENVAAAHPDVVERLMRTLEKGNTGLYQQP